MKRTLVGLAVFFLIIGCGKGGPLKLDKGASTAASQAKTNTDVFVPQGPGPSNSPSAKSPVYQDILAFTGQVGAGPNEISLSVTFPSDVSAYKSVTLARVQGNVPPLSNCSGTTAIMPLSPISGGFVDRTPGSNFGEVYSYRICTMDIYGNVRSNFTLSGLRAKPAKAPTCVVTLTNSKVEVGTIVVATLSVSPDTLSQTFAGGNITQQGGTIQFTSLVSGNFPFTGTVKNETGEGTCTASLQVDDFSKVVECGPWRNCPNWLSSSDYCNCPVDGINQITKIEVLQLFPWLGQSNVDCTPGTYAFIVGTEVHVNRWVCAGQFKVYYK